MSSYGENFGDAIAKISLKKPDGTYIENAAIQKGDDFPNTYRSHAFYILDTYSLDDYDLIIKLYSITEDRYKLLAFGDMPDGIYKQSIKYFKNRKCMRIVKALEDIHRQENSSLV